MARKKSSEGVQPQTVVAPVTASPEDPVLYVDASLDIQHIEQVAASLMGRLAAPGAVTIDLSRVSNVDTAGVQLLLALCNEASGRGMNLEFRGQSAALTEALSLLGLQGKIPAAPSHATQ
jgi:ABC-type transporter Mla MlaB component